ncbi:MAG: hypothetical protein R2864_07445 [Syntrophotaleaceae bacterium]
MSESTKPDELEQQPPATEPTDELEQLRRDIERQIRSNQRFLEGFLEENFTDEEE